MLTQKFELQRSKKNIRREKKLYCISFQSFISFFFFLITSSPRSLKCKQRRKFRLSTKCIVFNGAKIMSANLSIRAKSAFSSKSVSSIQSICMALGKSIIVEILVEYIESNSIFLVYSELR